ncbi:Citron Rho-interacting kinase [Manis javanica]|nr:Citron Rho-interacting kinase [Manis javanica]
MRGGGGPSGHFRRAGGSGCGGWWEEESSVRGGPGRQGLGGWDLGWRRGPGLGRDCDPGRAVAPCRDRAGSRLTQKSAVGAMPVLRPVSSYKPQQKTDGPVLEVDDFPSLSKRWDSTWDLPTYLLSQLNEGIFGNGVMDGGFMISRGAIERRKERCMAAS